ncbi:MAG: helix-turn-helix domain-containing protein [Lachnospiraceae bacterium]|nr:helix-turn-helix domain-containing protein [Lachnospiraceae bacterium]
MNARERLIELRKEMNLNRKQFCEYFMIPYRTVVDWEAGNRRVPEYLLNLMIYKAEAEKLLQKNEEEKEEKDGTK